MNLLKKAAFSLASTVSLPFLLAHTAGDILIPYQHLVSDAAVPWIDALYGFKNKAQFEADLDFLLAGFNPISLTELIRLRKEHEPVPANSFLLTFDDGFKEVYEVAMPVMLRKGVPAALFVNPPFLDNKELFYDLKKGLVLDRLETGPTSEAVCRELAALLLLNDFRLPAIKAGVRKINYLNQVIAGRLGEVLGLDFDRFLREVKPFMSSVQVKDFISCGFHLGAHSIDHPLYSLIPLGEQLRQTIESLDFVQQKFNLNYRAFAFPHLDSGVGEKFFRKLNQLAPGRQPDILFGNTTGKLDRHPRVLHRFNGENPDVGLSTQVKILKVYQWVGKATGSGYLNRKV